MKSTEHVMKTLDAEIDVRLIKARANVRMRQPFLGAVAMTMRVTPRPGIITMCTDGKDMFYDPEFLDTVSEAELTGVVAEEAYHKANKHHLRRKGRDPEDWNIACDYQIHNDLIVDGFKFPKFVMVNGEKRAIYHDPQYAGLAAEDIYHLLKKKQEEEQNAEASDEQEGDREERDSTSGMGGKGQNSEADPEEDETEEDEGHSGTDPDSDPESDEEVSDGSMDEDGDAENESMDGDSSEEGDPGAEEIAEIVAGVTSGVGMIIDAPDATADIETEIALQECISIAKRAGNLPAHIQRLINELVEPQTDWRTELRRFLSPSFTKDSTWSRPNRRVIGQGIILPGYIADGVGHIVIVVDDSGSVDDEALRRVFSEAQSALDEGKVDKVSVIYCDAAVHNEREYQAGDMIEVLPAGGGGTRFTPAFDWIKENAPEAAGVIYFTDMEAFDWPAVGAMEFQPPTLWAMHGDPRRFREITPPFGECIEVNYDN